MCRGKGLLAPATLAVALPGCALSGCALQTGVSTVHHTPSAPAARRPSNTAAWDVEGRIVDVNGRSGGYASGHVAMADPDAPSRFGVRRFAVGGGYRFIDCCVSLELGGELGAGEPTKYDYTSIGFYSGAVGTLMVRVLGTQDVDPGFAAVGVMLDVGVTTRVGAWLPAQGTTDRALFEGSLGGGLRATIVSDLFDATGEGFEP